MSIESEKDLLALLRIGRVVGLALAEMREALRPGITTAALDAIGAKVLALHGARPAPKLTYNFPATVCISVNDEAAHGIPGTRVIHEGDLVNIDVSAELGGYFADTGASIPVPPVSTQAAALIQCAYAALDVGINTARAGMRVSDVGRAIETYVRKSGFTIIRDLPGHGIGRKLHESPTMYNYDEKRSRDRLTEGLVVTIEPFISTRARSVVQGADGWTLRTPDGSLAAQVEHTVVITQNRPILVTAVQ